MIKSTIQKAWVVTMLGGALWATGSLASGVGESLLDARVQSAALQAFASTLSTGGDLATGWGKYVATLIPSLINSYIPLQYRYLDGSLVEAGMNLIKEYGPGVLFTAGSATASTATAVASGVGTVVTETVSGVATLATDVVYPVGAGLLKGGCTLVGGMGVGVFGTLEIVGHVGRRVFGALI